MPPDPRRVRPRRANAEVRTELRAVTWPVVALLTARRHALGLTQREVCERTGFDQSQLSDMERGYVDNPMTLTLLRWIRALGGVIEIRIRFPHS